MFIHKVKEQYNMVFAESTAADTVWVYFLALPLNNYVPQVNYLFLPQFTHLKNKNDYTYLIGLQ